MITIDEAIGMLSDMREWSKLGGNTCLVLSLTDSGLPDVDVDDLALTQDNVGAVVEVRVDHPDL